MDETDSKPARNPQPAPAHAVAPVGRRGVENAQFSMLNRLRREHTRVDVYLVTGTRLQGRVQSFDARSILLQTEAGGLLLYHHAVSSIQPSESRPRGASGQARSRPSAPRPARTQGEPRFADRSWSDDERAGPAHPTPRKPPTTPVVVTKRRSRIVEVPKAGAADAPVDPTRDPSSKD